MTAVVLHLSDIHIKNKHDPILARAKNIAACTYLSLPEASAVFVVVSGDIAFSGEADQYDCANIFFQEIRKKISESKNVPIHFIMCPGNHDCDFNLNTGSRNLVLSALASNETTSVDKSVIDTCCAVQKSYFAFEKQQNADFSEADGDELWKTVRYEVEGKEIAFDCMNVAWMSRAHEELGSLTFPFAQYIRSESAELQIGVLHHPYHWLAQRIYRQFRNALRQKEHIVISGHEHVGSVGENIDADSGHSAYIEGCVLQGEKNLSDSSFNIAVFDLNEGTYKSTQYKWAGQLYEASEEGSWEDYRNIPVKMRSPLEIQEAFRELLSDPGASFQKLSGHDISLSDIFVHPDLSSNSNAEESRRIVSSQILTDPSRLIGGVLLIGEERVGATSLLYQLYERYYDRGFVPVLLRGKDLRGAKHQDIDAAIRRAVQEQYGAQAQTKFEQIEKKKKLLLLDDFDECRFVATSFRAKAIAALTQRFEHVVITVGELFDIQETLASNGEDVLNSFHHYRMLPFGYALRAKLIRKWFHLNARDGSVSDASFLARCDQAEKLIDFAMVRNIVPPLPLYLLTLLLSIDAGLSGEFQESALGAYYSFLMSEGLRTAGIAKTSWDEITEYCADLAWFFHAKQKRELPSATLREFNSQFAVERHTVDFSERFKQLVQARVLAKVGDAYRFRYHYIYYLLKGRYLSRNVDRPDVRVYVTRCCRHLYVRENANTMLFMAHQQAGQKLVMDGILATLGDLFRDNTAVTFDGDTKDVDKLLRDLPKLEYSGEDPEKHRERVNKLRDEMDNGSDGLTEREEDGDVLSIPAQMIAVFKTIEILGQLLKNQSASLPRAKRLEVIEKLFKGPLRALRGYYDFISKWPDAMLAEIDAALKERGKFSDPERRQRAAREFMAFFIQLTTVGFICKTASSVSSETLVEDVSSAALKSGTTAFRMMELAVLLDMPNELPKAQLEKLIEETKSDLVSNRLLQFLVLQHLYMFRTTQGDKQWLASKKVIEVKAQQSIELRTLRTKKIK